jgi:uncharacterized protein GlcG (DUF336 family)
VHVGIATPWSRINVRAIAGSTEHREGMAFANSGAEAKAAGWHHLCQKSRLNQSIVQSSSTDLCDFIAALKTPTQELHMTRAAVSLSLDDARKIIAAGERKAIEIGIPYNIAVADAGGGLVSHVRMDGTWLGSVDIAINKAWTARAFDASTKDLAHLTQSGQPGFGLNTTNHSRVVIFGGGIPIKVDGVVIGAVGASGVSVEQDVSVARAAASGF